jgi:hypothetical protein
VNPRYVTPQFWWGQDHTSAKSRSPGSVHALDDLAKIWCLKQIIGVAPAKAALQAVMEGEDIRRMLCRALLLKGFALPQSLSSGANAFVIDIHSKVRSGQSRSSPLACHSRGSAMTQALSSRLVRFALSVLDTAQFREA